MFGAFFEGDHVFFMKTTAVTKETSCRCMACNGSFPCELWRYPDLVPVPDAAALPVEVLLARTNPGLAEREQLKQQVNALGGDARFAAAYEQLEGMRPGELHAGLLKQLLEWGRLEDDQRTRLVQRVGTCACAWHFARQVARGFPGHTGCWSAFLAAAAVWSAFLWARWFAVCCGGP